MQSNSWWLFLASLFVLGALLKVYLLAIFAVMLAVISVLARWWQKRALIGVIYRRRPFYWRGFPGEKINLRIEVENRKLLPISWLRIHDPWPYTVGPEDDTQLVPTENPDIGLLVNLFSLRWFERVRRSYTLLLRKRGVYRVGPARLESGDLFGIFEQSGLTGEAEFLTVFPEPLQFSELRLPAEDPFGDRRVRRRLYEDVNQPMGVRGYHPEDDFRRVHWPASAHIGELQVKVYQPVSAKVMVVCLNVTTSPHYWEGYYPELLEHLVRASAAIIQRSLEDGYRVGLISNGSLAHSDQPFRIQANRSPGQLGHLLQTLAGVTPFVIGPFDRFLRAEMPRLPYGASLVIVSGTMTPALAETILQLKQHGRRVTLLSFTTQDPPLIPGVQVLHRPFVL